MVIDNADFVFEVEATYHGMHSIRHLKVVSVTSVLQRQWIPPLRYGGSEKGLLTCPCKALLVYVPFAQGTFRTDGRPTGSDPFHASRGPLSAIYPLFPRRLQSPIPLGLNLLLIPGEQDLTGLGACADHDAIG